MRKEVETILTEDRFHYVCPEINLADYGFKSGDRVKITFIPKQERTESMPLVKTPEEIGYEHQMRNDILYFGRLGGE
jgi:hypothetical protein